MTSVSIAIAAYNAEKNIGQLLISLRQQLQNTWKLDRIVVHSDSSQDKTIQVVKKFADKKIYLIDNKYRKGFAGSVKTLLSKSDSDITILLNDDIKIIDKSFIEKIVQAFNFETNIGLVTARPIPLPPKTFVERSIIVTINAFENTLYDSGKYQNIFTCDGKVMALSRKFKNLLRFPDNIKNTGNVDSYIYLSCIKSKMKYFHEKNAIVYFRCPSTFRDWIRWTSRNNADKIVLMPTFGLLVAKEFRFPDSRKLALNKAIQLLTHPLESLIAAFIGAYSFHRAKSHQNWLTSTWELVTTSKIIES